MSIWKKIFLVIKECWSSIIELIGLILGTVVLFDTENNLKKIFFLLIIIVSIILVILKIIEKYCSYDKNAYPTKEKINNFMYNWLNDNGKSVVFSRDMSWGADNKINFILKEKAKKNELTIILSCKNDLSEELEELGATIIEYGYLDFTPETRFTIVDYGSIDSKVAIGQKDEMEIHRINKYNKSDVPIFYLASDLIKLIKKLEKDRKKNIEEN